MRTVIIGVAGGTASGKTTIALKLFEQSKAFGPVALIRLDDYYKDLSHLSLEERKAVNYVHPDSLDFDLLHDHLMTLRDGRDIEKPLYDFVEHNRGKETEWIRQPVKVVILEGILTLSEESIRQLCDIKLYVDTADDIRFIRRLVRDTKKRGRSLDSVVNQYLSTVKPMHMQFVEPSKRYADLIIPEGGHNPIVIDLISAKIRSILFDKI